ncbi:MAG: aspartate aminotransferase family protein [Phycisphaerales bacterium]|nr:MAG: aspartate aminotransferase family protein [Phycisphaerales bacterium]
MPLDLAKLIEEQRGRNYELHREHINPQFARVLKTIGFDRCYVRGEGQYLWDVEGTKYLDLLGGYAVFNMGRNHPGIKQALRDFLDQDVASLVQMEAPLFSGLLAEELKRRMPNDLDIVYFTNTGAEGVETAIKFARRATERPAILHAAKAYHGLSTGALALNGCESFRSGFAPYLPHCREIPFNDLNALEDALRSRDVAAFVVEPIQGKGVHIPTPGYLREASALCKRYGTLFVADEIQTGMGRTGRFLAIEHEEAVDPDIVILSKALSGGFVPVGAVLTRKWIYDRVFFSMDRAVVHSSTFGQGAMAMVAGLASLRALDDDDLMNNADRMGTMIRDGIEAMVPRFEFLHGVRQRGLMIGIQFGPPASLGLRTGWSLIHKMDKNLFPQAVTIPLLDQHKILTQVAGHETNVVKLIPPLCLNEADVQHFLSAFEQVMVELHQFPGPVWRVLKKLGTLAVTQRARARPEKSSPV